MVLQIDPITRPFDAVVDLPGSKSYTNRALLIAALARGQSRISEALSSDDTRHMRRALATLGVRIEDVDAAHLRRRRHRWPLPGVHGDPRCRRRRDCRPVSDGRRRTRPGHIRRRWLRGDAPASDPAADRWTGATRCGSHRPRGQRLPAGDGTGSGDCRRPRPGARRRLQPILQRLADRSAVRRPRCGDRSGGRSGVRPLRHDDAFDDGRVRRDDGAR